MANAQKLGQLAAPEIQPKSQRWGTSGLKAKLGPPGSPVRPQQLFLATLQPLGIQLTPHGVRCPIGVMRHLLVSGGLEWKWSCQKAFGAKRKDFLTRCWKVDSQVDW